MLYTLHTVLQGKVTHLIGGLNRFFLNSRPSGNVDQTQGNSPRSADPWGAHPCTVGWSDLALFQIFENLHISADRVYF